MSWQIATWWSGGSPAAAAACPPHWRVRGGQTLCAAGRVQGRTADAPTQPCSKLAAWDSRHGKQEMRLQLQRWVADLLPLPYLPCRGAG